MGSTKRRPPILSRAYRPDPDHCARAIQLLLAKPTKNKKAAENGKPEASHAGVGSAR